MSISLSVSICDRIRGRFCVFVLMQHGHKNKHDQERIHDYVYKQVHENELVFVHVHTNKYRQGPVHAHINVCTHVCTKYINVEIDRAMDMEMDMNMGMTRTWS